MKGERIIFVIVVVILLACIMGMWFYFQKRIKQDLHALGQVQLVNTILKKHLNEKGQEVAQFKANVFTLRQLNALGDSTIKALLKENKNYKWILAHTSISSSTTDTIWMPGKDSLVYVGDSVPQRLKTFDHADAWMVLHGMYNLSTDSVRISYNLFNESKITYAWTRDGLFKKKYIQGSVTQLNPNTVTNKVVQFVIEQEPRKFYDHWWFSGGIGLLGGFLVGKATN